MAAAAAGKPLALRISAVAALAAYAPEAAVEPTALLAQDTTSVDARNAGRGGLRGLGPAGQARLAELPAPPTAAPQPAAKRAARTRTAGVVRALDRRISVSVVSGLCERCYQRLIARRSGGQRRAVRGIG